MLFLRNWASGEQKYRKFVDFAIEVSNIADEKSFELISLERYGHFAGQWLLCGCFV